MMRKSAWMWLGLGFVLAAADAAAQSNVTTTNGGTAGTVPVFTTGTNVENSPISVSGSKVGIGTTSPTLGTTSSPGIDIYGLDPALRLQDTEVNGDTWEWDAYVTGEVGVHYGALGLSNLTTGNLALTFLSTGDVGIGTQLPTHLLDVEGGQVNASGGYCIGPNCITSWPTQLFSLPNTGATAQWIELGTFNASQQGYDVDVKIVASNGYNASATQDQVSYIHFKTSNGSSVDQNDFGGDSWWYQTGPNTNAPSQIAWVANTLGASATTFTLYAYFGTYSGTDSYYVVDVPPGTSWTNVASPGNPGSGNTGTGMGGGLILSPPSELYVGSMSTFASNVGIGTTNPIAPLDVETSGTSAIRGINSGQTSNDANGSFVNLLKSRAGVAVQNGDNIGSVAAQPFDGTQYDNPARIRFMVNGSVATGSVPTDIEFLTGTGGGGAEAMRVASTGYVGIGTPTPQAALEINGNLRFTADGSVQKTAWTGILCGGDYAEAVNASGGKKSYEPGDVLVLASDKNGNVDKSSEPYSTMVAGIFATKPGVIGRRATLVQGADEIPMAMVGIVPTKVSAENGAIRQGDLLVTSSKVGYAMKGTDRAKMLGAVIGKAMGSLDSGTGVIEVLVTLQ